MAESTLTNEQTGRQFVITRDFDAPRELVWKAWTEPERMAQWWGPKGFTMLTSKMDLRLGGIYQYGMRSPEGFEMWGKFTYREIVAPERLVFVDSFSDEEGGVTRHPLSPTWPLEVLNTLTLTEHDGVTTLTLQVGPVNATDEERLTFEAGFESMQKGFTGTLDQLSEYLKTETENADREIVMTRVFDAPRELVFEAWTDPEQVRQWWGPRGFTTTIHEMDVRPGGVWRFIMHGPDGTDYDNKIVYSEIVRPERLVYDHGSDKEDDPGQFHVTVTFAKEGDRTRLTMRLLFASTEARDAVIEFGAVEKGNQTLECLAEHLAKK